MFQVMRGVNEENLCKVMPKISTTVKNIKFPDTVIIMLLLIWHQLLFSVYECFYKLNKNVYLYVRNRCCTYNILRVRKSNVSINSKTFF